LTECFDRGFDCFSKDLSGKGVIQVNKSPKKGEAASTKTTPKKYNTSVIEEVDEELQKTERKSVGENTLDCFAIKNNKEIDNLDKKSTPNLNHSKYSKATSSKTKSGKKS